MAQPPLSNERATLSNFLHHRRGLGPRATVSAARSGFLDGVARIMDPRLATARAFAVAAETPSPVNAVGANPLTDSWGSVEAALLVAESVARFREYREI